MSFLSSLDNLFQDAYIILKKQKTKTKTKKQQDMTVPFARARAKLGGSIR